MFSKQAKTSLSVAQDSLSPTTTITRRPTKCKPEQEMFGTTASDRLPSTLSCYSYYSFSSLLFSIIGCSLFYFFLFREGVDP